jgi:hypothetical protein
MRFEERAAYIHFTVYSFLFPFPSSRSYFFPYYLPRYFGDKEKNDPQVLALAEELDNGPTAELLR